MIARKKKAIVRRETEGERIWFDEVEGKRGKSLSSEIWNGDQFVSTAKLWRFLVPVLIFEQRSRKLCRLGTTFRDFGRVGVQPSVKGISLYTDAVAGTDGWHSL